MTLGKDELLAAYRAERGPSDAAEQRLLDRLDALGPPPAALDPDVLPFAKPSPMRRGVAIGAAVAALAAAVALGWWMRGDVAASEAEHDRSLAADRAVVPQNGGTAKSIRGNDVAPKSGRAQPAVTPPPAPSTELAAEPEPAPEPAPTTGASRPGTAATRPARSPSPRRPEPRPQPQPPHADPPVQTPSVADSLAAEARRVGQARRALAAGRPAKALSLLSGYEETFPGATLAEEADAIRTMARCRTSASPGVLGRAFALRRAKSIFAKQVRDACPERPLQTDEAKKSDED